MKKSTIMKPKTIQQEILLITGTSFSSNEFCLKDPQCKESAYLSPLEQLEKVCWAGILSELLPELTDCSFSNCKTYIWNILKGNHFLNINMGDRPPLRRLSCKEAGLSRDYLPV